MKGTPSWSFGSSRPWKWIAVDSGELVVSIDAHAVAFADADLRAGDLVVVRPRLHRAARLGLPLDLLGGELVDLHALLHPRREQLVALAGGLGRERLDALLVHRVHRVRLLARGKHRSGCGCACLGRVCRSRGALVSEQAVRLAMAGRATAAVAPIRRNFGERSGRMRGRTRRISRHGLVRWTLGSGLTRLASRP